jgi:hypothetical protein
MEADMRYKSLRRTVTAAILTLVATAAYGQKNALTAKIPFAFRAVGSDLPAGSYEVGPTAGPSGAMELRNMDTGKAVFIPAKGPAVKDSKGGRPRLIFQCAGKDCSLAKIWSGEGSGLEFPTPPPTAAQRERLETVYLDRFKDK